MSDNVIYIQSNDIDCYGFIKNYDYYNSLEYTKKFTDAMLFTDDFFKGESFNVLVRLLESQNLHYRIFKW